MGATLTVPFSVHHLTVTIFIVQVMTSGQGLRSFTETAERLYDFETSLENEGINKLI